MSESSNEQNEDGAGISDDQLPEDLQPSEDNPLAEPLTEEEAPDDMDDLDMMGGGSSGDSDGDSGDEDTSGESGDDPPSDGESAGDDGED
jgi:hypothetical protein